MEPFEIMVSESQERMLAVVEPDQVDAVMDICRKWQTVPAVIGEITDTGNFTILKNGETVGSIAVDDLVDGCPLYDLDPIEPSSWIYGNRVSLESGSSASDVALALLGSPSIASKRWVYEQYDSIVGSRTIHRAGSTDAAVLNIPEADRAIAVAIDGNGRRVACDPYTGTIEGLLECAANLACVGAEPLGVTNCLNFGNPEKGTVAWQLSQSVTALGDACRAMDLPVVGGNVSLYSETPSGPIYPTPVIGMVGELFEPESCGGRAWEEGDAIAMVGPFNPSLAGSELEKMRGQLGAGLPAIEIAPIRAAIELVRDSVRKGLIGCVSDISDGGITTTLAEAAVAANIGCLVDLEPIRIRHECSAEDALFGEAPGGFLVAGEKSQIEMLAGQDIEVDLLGEVTGETIDVTAANQRVEMLVAEAAAAFDSLAHDIEA